MKSLILFISVLFILPLSSIAQTKISGQSRYVGKVDQSLTIKKIAILPFKDNVGGTYARALEEHTKNFIQKDHKWDLVQQTIAGSIPTPSKLEKNPNALSSLSRSIDADAFIIAEFINTPKGLNLKLDLFLTADNKLLIQSKMNRLQEFAIKNVKLKYDQFLKTFMKKLPYNGLILSRTGNKVTLNLGQKDNIRAGQVLTASQIISLNRHPKFNFIISANKEILGQIKITKSDDYLSFGEILNEKERGSIQAHAKITGAHHIVYNSNTGNSHITAGAPEGSVLYGKNPKAWRPSRTPTFGLVGAHIGIGQHNETAGNISASANFTPNLTVESEVWVTPKWSAHLELMQGFTSVDDSDFTLSSYDILIGRNFRLLRKVDSPYIEILGGFSGFTSKVSGSNSNGFLTAKYKSIKLGLTGATSIDIYPKWSIGGEFFVHINPDVDITPSLGVGSDPSATQIGIYGKYKMNSRVNFIGKVDLDNYSTSSSVQNTSQKTLNLSAGLRYLF